ncbi:MAG: cytochrome C [Bacteroidetes bacterium]|jgi:hypothetical protein|nr:cytochrome C [Bacteroidota bacterium]
MRKISVKKIIIVLGVILVLIQFYSPQLNNGTALGGNDFTHTMSVPNDVMQILKTSCFDCHSNHTDYPWYSKIQPIGIWLANHIDEGKRELNFSEFNTYKAKRKRHKLEELVKEVKEHEMPLSSYTIIHKNAVLTNEQAQLLINWADSAYQLIPLDSNNHK